MNEVPDGIREQEEIVIRQQLAKLQDEVAGYKWRIRELEGELHDALVVRNFIWNWMGKFVGEAEEDADI